MIFLKTGWFAVAVVVLAGWAVPAAAQTPANDPVPLLAAAPAVSAWRVSGFGTLSHSWDDRDDLALIRDISQRPRQNYATGPTWRLDSRLGVQLNYRFSPQVEAVAQVVARDQDSDEFKHAVDLAYLDIQAAPDWRLRLGRTGYDAFLMSDHRNLGYAYAWVRPPIEFYSWTPIFSVTGADLSYEFAQGDARWRLRAQAGNNDFIVPMGDIQFNFRAEKLLGLSLLRESGAWRLKASVSSMTSASEVPSLVPLHQGLEQIAGLGLPGISAEAAMLRRESSFKDVRIRYASLGVAYDDETLFAQAELGSNWTDTTFVPQTRNAYAVLGRRIGAWSPFVMIGISRPNRDLLSAQHDWSPLGDSAASLQTMTYQSIVNSTRFDQETVSLGVRWDVDPRAALKLQWDHTRIHPQGYAAWFRDRALLDHGATVNLLTLGVDFVF